MRAAPQILRPLAALLLLAVGCGKAPKLETPGTPQLPPAAAPEITIESVSVATGRVVVTYSLSDGGTPVTGTAASDLKPRWTLAWLDVEPVSGLPAWRGLIFTGNQTVPSLKPAGAETPPGEILTNVRQPGTDLGGTTTELGGGRFTYAFGDALNAQFLPPSGANAGATLRVGAFLDGVTKGSAATAKTRDFVPNGGTLAHYETTRDENCATCHGTLRAHEGRRVGVKLCLTCHTWLAADPDTSDPEQMALGTDTSDPTTLAQRALAKAATDPNPLELGRFVHRIHRGKTLPTLYRSSTCYTSSTKTGVTAPPSTQLCNIPVLPPTFPAGGPPPAFPASPGDLPWTVPALPFRSARNTLGPAGLEYAVICNGVEFAPGRLVSRITNLQAAQTLAEGVGFPQDLRNCDACHAGATDAGAKVTSISRRTCSGCHPDVWYGVVATPADLDAFHMPHSGGPQADDSACAGCHVTLTGYRKVPIAEFHQAPLLSPRPKLPSFQIVSVANLRPGTPGTPGPVTATIRFKASDYLGTLTPPGAPTPVWDSDATWPSPVPRKLTSLTFRIGGPNTDYLTGGGFEQNNSTGSLSRGFSWSVTTGTTTTLPWTATCTGPTGSETDTMKLIADGSGVFTCNFPNPFANLNTTAGKVDVQGTFTLMVEGRRASAQTQYPAPAPYTSSTAPFRPADWPWYGWVLGYDPVSDTFRWPGTGETVTEAADNAFVSVDLSTGSIASSPTAARRGIVGKTLCNACHLRITGHGSRTDPEACHFCHAADATDWMYRPRDLRPTIGTGQVLLNSPLAYPADTTKAWTYWTGDGIEERSIQLKTMIHRIHTGEREGPASLEGIRPFAIQTGASRYSLLDDVKFPNDLGNCEVCHLRDTWRIEAVPSTAAPTMAHEAASLVHLPLIDPGTGTMTAPASQAHDPSEAIPAVVAACLSCHTNGAAADHAAAQTSAEGVPLCASCHGESGAESVRKWHSVP